MVGVRGHLTQATTVDGFLGLIAKYGLSAVLIVVLGAVVAYLAGLIYKRLNDQLKQAQDENAKLRDEIKTVYADLQRYLVIGMATKQAINEATDKIVGQK